MAWKALSTKSALLLKSSISRLTRGIVSFRRARETSMLGQSLAGRRLSRA